ncbi:MAG: hypothetical protein ABS942_17405 [Solibacillus sp.]
MNKVILIGYFLSIVILLYFGLNGIITSAMGDTFPNTTFFIILILILITAFNIGIIIRKHLSLLDKNTAEKSQKAFALTSVLGFVVVLILFSFN